MPQKSAMWQKSDAKNWQTLSVSVSCGIHIIKKYPALSVFPGGVVVRAPATIEHFALGTGSIPTSCNQEEPTRDSFDQPGPKLKARFLPLPLFS